MIVAILFATDVFFFAKRKYENDVVQEKKVQIENQLMNAADNIADWKLKLAEYEDDLKSVSSSIAETKAKLKEFRNSWLGVVTEWWYEEDIKILEQTLASMEKQQEKLQERKKIALERISHYDSQLALYEIQQELIANRAIEKSKSKWREYSRTAILIIFLGWISFLFLRLLIYYVIAPWVGKKSPICIDEFSDGDLSFNNVEQLKLNQKQSVRIGSTSLEISFGKNEELLTHQKFLQSSFEADKKQIIPFLSKSYWITSIFSGLWGMLRCQTNEEMTTLTLSDPKGIVSAIDVISLPSASKFVCQARSIVGVVREREGEVHLKSVWRFGWHNWLMLRFRYLVFSGDCKLILKGKHGIVVEMGGRGKVINPDLVLGFSANLNYSNARSESFWGYLLGWDNIFNDRFQNSSNKYVGFYICEEVPDTNKGEIRSRGLTGILDTILKVFGI